MKHVGTSLTGKDIATISTVDQLSGVVVPIVGTLPVLIGYGAKSQVVTLPVVGITPSSTVFASFRPSDLENSLDDLEGWSISAEPVTGAINFNFSCATPMGGPVQVHYLYYY